MISPRFSIDGPSLIDDWSAISRSPAQLVHPGRLLSADGPRFRPGFVVWNYVQWHTLGAPRGLAGPNAWGVARLLLFLIGVALVTVLALWLGGYRAHPPRFAFLLVGLAPLALLAMPTVAIDFARFGPQEPLLVGGLAVGGSLLALAAREIAGHRPTGRTARIAACICAGYPLWLLGVYQKEVSVCVLVLVPFLYLAARDRIATAVRAADGTRRLLLAVLAGAALVPLLDVAVEVALIVRRGNLVYGAQVRTGSAFRLTYDFVSDMPVATGSWLGWGLILITAAGLFASLARRRPDWLLGGCLAAAAVCLAWSAQSGVSVSRYYIPSLALCSIGTVLVLAKLGRRSGLVAIAVVCAAVAVSAPVAHSRVAGWAADEKQGVSFVAAVARARASGCPVAISDLDPERTAALPVLSALTTDRSASDRACRGRAFLAAGPRLAPVLASACPPGDRRMLGEWALGSETVRLVRCRGLPAAAMRVLADRGL